MIRQYTVPAIQTTMEYMEDVAGVWALRSRPVRAFKYFVDLSNTPAKLIADNGSTMLVECDTYPTLHSYLISRSDVTFG